MVMSLPSRSLARFGHSQQDHAGGRLSGRAKKGICRSRSKMALSAPPDFHVDGGTFGMVGEGNAHFLDDKIDFDVRIDASGAGAVLTPLYRIFRI